MKQPRQMDPADVLYLASENERIFFHTAGLVLLDARDPKFSFERFRQRCIERLGQVPQFRWKLHQVPLGLDLPYWIEDENFDWNNHFKRIAVPSPGDPSALGQVASYLYARQLDQSRPLWEMWYIEGLEGGRVAIMQKTHHCMMDGQGMQKLGELLCDFSPRGKAKTVAAEIAEAQPGPLPDQRQLWENALRHWAGFPFETGKRLASMMGPKLAKRREQKRPKNGKPELPRVFFNADFSAGRCFVYHSLPLADIKRVKDAFGVTVNDVIMALVSGSLRRYLLTYEELPAESLYGAMPVSLRNEGDDDLGNKVTSTPVSLATAIEDPLARLAAISESANEAKLSARAGGVGITEVVEALPPLLQQIMLTQTKPEQMPNMIGANLVVSNVRGSQKPMYIAGARMESMYPLSILTPGMGLNITCVSYCDSVDFGFTLAPEMFAEPWALVDGLEATLREYLELAAPKRRARKKKPARKRGKASS